MEDMLNSGAISGALDPNSNEATVHARMYYDEIRKNHSDVHILNDKIARFDPEIHIAQSWQRLAFDQKNVLPHDMILIQHDKKMGFETGHYKTTQSGAITRLDFSTH
jgi:hypothetical protein